MKIKNGLLFYVVFKTILLADIEAIVSEMVNETAELLLKVRLGVRLQLQLGSILKVCLWFSTGNSRCMYLLFAGCGKQGIHKCRENLLYLELRPAYNTSK